MPTPSTTRPLSERQRELLAMPPLHSSLPITLPRGHVWNTFEGRCRACQTPIEPELLRGCITHPTPQVWVIEAVGACGHCRIATPFLYRLYDDRRIAFFTDSGWVFMDPPPTRWQLIRQRLTALLRFGRRVR